MTEEHATSAEQVTAWLRHHPDFFQTRPDLLELMRLPDPRGEAVSLLERQASILRDRNGELRDRLNALLDIARENDSLFEKTRQLTLKLIEARSLESLCKALVDSLRTQFGSDAVTLLIYDRDVSIDGTLREHVRVVDSSAQHEALQTLLRQGKAVCGILRDDEVRELFPQQANEVRSAAMVPLDFQGRQGLLAIGSINEHHFRSSLGTLFISHLGDVIARRLADTLRDARRLEAKRA
jgi:uncharacterized protein